MGAIVESWNSVCFVWVLIRLWEVATLRKYIVLRKAIDKIMKARALEPYPGIVIMFVVLLERSLWNWCPWWFSSRKIVGQKGTRPCDENDIEIENDLNYFCLNWPTT